MSVYVNLTHKNSSIHGRDEPPQTQWCVAFPQMRVSIPRAFSRHVNILVGRCFFITMYWCPQANACF